jgi:hypothetical protein
VIRTALCLVLLLPSVSSAALHLGHDPNVSPDPDNVLIDTTANLVWCLGRATDYTSMQASLPTGYAIATADQVGNWGHGEVEHSDPNPVPAVPSMFSTALVFFGGSSVDVPFDEWHHLGPAAFWTYDPDSTQTTHALYWLHNYPYDIVSEAWGRAVWTNPDYPGPWHMPVYSSGWGLVRPLSDFVPEPASLAVWGLLGMIGLAVCRRRFRS